MSTGIPYTSRRRVAASGRVCQGAPVPGRKPAQPRRLRRHVAMGAHLQGAAGRCGTHQRQAHKLFCCEHNYPVRSQRRRRLTAGTLAMSPLSENSSLVSARRQLPCIAPGPGVAPGGHLPRIIMPSTSSFVTLPTLAVPTTRPFFITATRSARSNTSWIS